MLRYPMIYLIVIVHVPRMISFVDEPTILTFIGSFVTEGLARTGIPMLTCISGFFVFHKALDLNLPLLLRKRFVSLVTPLLVWNVPVVLALYVVQSQGLIDYDFAVRKTMYPFDPMIWVNGIFSVTDYPVNYPMHFLRDLFVICFFAPVMGLSLRRYPFMGLIALLVMFVPDFDGLLIRNNSMPIMFYIGGMATTMNWDLKRLDKYAIPLACLLLLVCAVVVFTGAGRPFWVRVLAPFAVWPASSMLLGTRTGRWLIEHSRASVFLFMFHGLMLLTLKAAFPRLYSSEYAFYAWLMLPVFVAITSQFAYLLLDRLFPGFLTVLLGGRKATAHKVATVNS